MTLLVGALTLLPLLLFLNASPLQPSGPSATLLLCRVSVTPCQKELNLPVDGEVTLSLFIDRDDNFNPMDSWSLAAWYVKLLFQPDDTAAVPRVGSTDKPFLESGFPGMVLNDVASLSEETAQIEQGSVGFFRVRNRYDAKESVAEYSVTLVGRPGSYIRSQVPLLAGENVLLGNVTLRGSNAGTTQLATEDSPATSPEIVVFSSSEKPTPIALQSAQPLAIVNVGTDAEKARLQGNVWSDLPTGDESLHPFTDEFKVELWRPSSLPVWLGGVDRPTARFTNLAADSKGRYSVSDLSPRIIPSGTYDIRASGVGTLTRMIPNVPIDTSGSNGRRLPVAVDVDLGPLLSGDLTGDNLVDRNDLSRIKTDFGKRTRTLEAGAEADFNDDGVIDGQDFSLMAANYGKSGE